MDEMSSFFNQDLKKRDVFFSGSVNTAWQTMVLFVVFLIYLENLLNVSFFMEMNYFTYPSFCYHYNVVGKSGEAGGFPQKHVQ